MAVTLPDERELGGLPGMSGQRAIGTPDATPIARGAAAIGEGVKGLGKGIETLGLGVADYELNNARFEYAKAHSAFIVGKAALDDEFLDDTDYKTQPERYNEKLTKLRDDAAQAIGSSPMRERFNTDSDQAIGLAGIKQSRTAFHGIARTELAKADEDVEAMRQAALRSKDEGERASIIGAVNGRIDTLVANKWIDPVAAQKYKKNFAEKYAIGEVAMLPAEQQIKMLQEPAGDKEATLDRIGGVENATGNPAERSKTSSAMGNFQFIKSTWLDNLKKYRPDIAQGRSDDALLALRADPGLSREMAGHLYDDNSRALTQAGLSASPGNIYLAHFLGADGAIATLKAKPGTPAVDAVGQQAVDANRTVLAGKTTDSVVAWANGKMSGTPRGQGSAIDFIPEDKRQEMLMRAQASVVTQARQTNEQIAQEQYTVSDLVKSDLSSMANTGKGVDGLSYERVQQSLGTAKAEEWKQLHDDSHTVFLATADLQQLDNQELEQRKLEVQPQAGQPDFARKQAIADAIVKGIDKVKKTRDEDPAASVSGAMPVMQALTEVNPKDPSSWMKVGQARLAQQQATGIPEDNQSPLTKAEAMQLTVPLRRMLPGQERETITALAEQLDQMFGVNADKAFQYALRVHAVSAETAKAAVSIMKKLSLGEVTNVPEGEDFDMKTDLDAAERTMRNYDALHDLTLSTSATEFGGGGAAVVGAAGRLREAEPGVNIPKGAIVELRANPDLAAEFNRKYGNGKDVAKEILGTYGKGKGAGKAQSAEASP